MKNEIVKKDTLGDILKDNKAYLELLTEYARENEGELTDQLEVWEKEILSRELKKVDSYVTFYKWLESESERMKKLSDEFLAKKKLLDNKIDKMKNYVKYSMVESGIENMQGENYKISLVNNGGVLPLEFTKPILPEQLEDRFCKTVRSIDNSAIRKVLESGEVLKFAKLGERGKSVRIK